MFSWRGTFGTIVKAAAAVVLATGIAATAKTAEAAAPKGVYPDRYAAIVVDTATGKVLYEANADARRYPASLTKMMTLYVLFEDLDRGRFRLDSRLTVSAVAASQPPSKLGLRAGDTITVEDAIKALVTKSANDAAATIGENLAGSIPAFAERMTRTARAIGMSNTVFRNANGLPNPGQYTSARDMMKLGVALQVRFPSYYGYFQTRSFAFRGHTIGNHNNLLGRIDGVDGIKTGYIAASGFNLVTSIKRDGRKLVAVVMGGRTARSRDAHMVQLINTYLPAASRARGYDDDLVASIKAAPKVAASVPMPVVAAAVVPPVGADHPVPPPRPAVVTETVTPEIVTASVAIAPPRPERAPVALTRAVQTQSIPVPVAEPVSLADAQLPSSAAEAFAEVAPLSAGERDALGAMIETASTSGRVEVASVDSDLPLPAPAPVPAKAAPVAVAAAPAKPVPAAVSDDRRPTGWVIQIGAVGSRDAANDLLKRAQSKAGRVLASADPVTEIYSKSGQTYVRARFAGFDNEKEASRACAALKKNAFNCYTLRL